MIFLTYFLLANMVKRYHFKLFSITLEKSINLPVIQGYWNLEIRINQFCTNVFVNLGVKKLFY